MVEAGRRFLLDINYTLFLEIKTNEDEFSVDFDVEYSIGSPWTLLLKDSEYGEISIDFGRYLLIPCFIHIFQVMLTF